MFSMLSSLGGGGDSGSVVDDGTSVLFCTGFIVCGIIP